MLFITLEGLLPARNNNLVYVTMKYPSMSMGLVIVGFKYIVSIGYFQSLERDCPAMIITLLRGFALILLCFWILPIIWGSWGIWLPVLQCGK